MYMYPYILAIGLYRQNKMKNVFCYIISYIHWNSSGNPLPFLWFYVTVIVNSLYSLDLFLTLLLVLSDHLTACPLSPMHVHCSRMELDYLCILPMTFFSHLCCKWNLFRKGSWSFFKFSDSTCFKELKLYSLVMGYDYLVSSD